MKHYAVGCIIGLTFVGVVSACGSDDISTVSDDASQFAGGAPSSGGSAAGGNAATGGASAVTASTGGSLGSGGMVAAGGSDSSGGMVAAGGSDSSGGFAATGGDASGTGGNAVGTGGAVSTETGGSSASGTGGTASTGGESNTGGASSSGGSSGTGGGKAVGGGKAAGGSVSTGGAPTTGGSASTGGTTSTSPGCGHSNLPPACSSTSTGTCSLTINGTKRSYYVVLPTNYDPNRAYPVITAWHYLNGTAEALLPSTFSFGGISNFYGIRTGFPDAIYVTAQGLPGTPGGIDYGWANTGGQDVAFARAIIDWLNSNFCVDTSRIFSTGFSYGGMMSATLGCQMANTYRAIAVMSGAAYFANNCESDPVAAWFTHGDADTLVAISGGQAARDLFIKQNGCSTTNTQSVAINGATCTLYSDCTSGNNPVVWCPVSGGGHAVPSFAASEITKFFLQF